MYEIRIYRKAKEYLKKVPYKESKTILNEIFKLKEKPYSHSKLKPLKGYKKLWKLYIKENRAIIKILLVKNKIIVLAIGHRRNVYTSFFEDKKSRR